MARTHPIGEMPESIDAGWWLEFRRHATGVAATFTPAVIGFAAPLENLSAALDATPRPWFVLGPLAMFGLFSTWLSGGMIERLQHRRSIGWRTFVTRSGATFWRVLRINIAAVAVAAFGYLTLHPLLFSWAYPVLSGASASDAGKFGVRVALYVLFGGVLVLISLVADYARIHAVLRHTVSVRDAYAGGWSILRTRWRAVLVVLVMVSLCFVLLLAAYGVIDLQGGSRVGGWRAVAVAQAFILGRVVLRVINVAAQVGVASPAAT
jgi:hypothetical protein